MAEKGPRSEVVRGRRVETVEYGLRTPTDTYFHRKWYVEPMSSLERAVECRDRTYTGRRGDEVPISRVIVTYTTDWAPVPGVEAGTLHLSCNHGGTPKGYVGDANFGLGSAGPGVSDAAPVPGRGHDRRGGQEAPVHVPGVRAEMAAQRSAARKYVSRYTTRPRRRADPVLRRG